MLILFFIASVAFISKKRGGGARAPCCREHVPRVCFGWCFSWSIFLWCNCFSSHREITDTPAAESLPMARKPQSKKRSWFPHINSSLFHFRWEVTGFLGKKSPFFSVLISTSTYKSLMRCLSGNRKMDRKKKANVFCETAEPVRGSCSWGGCFGCASSHLTREPVDYFLTCFRDPYFRLWPAQKDNLSANLQLAQILLSLSPASGHGR